MKLLELQRRMAADLMRPLTRHDNLSPKVKAAEYISPNDRLTSQERLEIYSRSYWYRILDSLYDDFSGLRGILGDELFHRLSRDYLAAHPSQSFTMRNLGCKLEEWLRPRRQYTGGKHALALDMVQLEWAHIEAFDGPPAKLLGPEDLLELSPDLRMSLQPYLTLLEVRHAVDDLRIRISRTQDLHGAASNAVTEPRHRATKRRTVARSNAPIFIAVHRFDNSVYYRRIEPGAFRILTALQRGESIGTAVDAGCEDQASIATWFETWSELGWLCKYEAKTY